MILSQYFVLFILYSFFGWCFETIYCTVTEQKWANRGFLYGPICPIYGFGAVAISIVIDLIHIGSGPQLTVWQIFLISVFGSAVLEYLTSWILEKQFHAYWWDYSNMPLNLNGRICLPASLLFGAAGVFIVFWLYPRLQARSAIVPPLVSEGVSLILMALFAADFALTVSALTRLDTWMQSMEESINLHMEAFVDNLNERTQSVSLRIAEEKERFTRQHMERFTHIINPAHRHALARVKGFRPNLKKHPQRPREWWDSLLDILHNQKKSK